MTKDKQTRAKGLVELVASSRWGGWFMRRIAHHLDRWLSKRTKGKLSTMTLAGRKMIMLTAIGAKSGKKRTIPLAYIKDGDNFILIASNWGNTRHPAWYYNLLANPEATLTLNTVDTHCVAYEATGAERERLWEKAVDFYPGYASYQKRTDGRQIPVMVLVPKMPA